MRMQRQCLVLLATLFATASTAWAVILDGDSLRINLVGTNLPCRLQHSPHMVPGTNGLHYAGQSPVPMTWIQTDAIPIGFAWALPRSVQVGVTVDQSYTNQDDSSRDPTRYYFRYGIDGEHWSTWIPIERNEKQNKHLGQFLGEYRIPEYECQKICKLRQTWSQSDRSYDEERFYSWVAVEHPDILSSNIAHIGYVQVLVEWPGYKLKQLEVKNVTIFTGWGLGGAAGRRRDKEGKSIQLDPGLPKEELRWHFRLNRERNKAAQAAP
jgi:hypothetical protein